MGMKGDTGVMGAPGAQGNKGDPGKPGLPGKRLHCTVADLEEMPLFLGARTSDSILRSLYPLQVWLGLLESKVIKVGTVGIWAE